MSSDQLIGTCTGDAARIFRLASRPRPGSHCMERSLRVSNRSRHYIRAAVGSRRERCHAELSTEATRDFIKRDAPGTARGWRWQGT
jgi:hypothetical protein